MYQAEALFSFAIWSYPLQFFSFLWFWAVLILTNKSDQVWKSHVGLHLVNLYVLSFLCDVANLSNRNKSITGNKSNIFLTLSGTSRESNEQHKISACEVLCETVWYVYQCVRAWVCVWPREAQWVGESGSAGTHSCFMVLFQEELLDLLVFTGSQFVCLRVCIFASMF